MMLKKVIVGIVLWGAVLSGSCQLFMGPDNNQMLVDSLWSVRDSLDKIVFEVPKMPNGLTNIRKHYINSQEGWDRLPVLLKKWLRTGERNISIIVNAKRLIVGDKVFTVENLDYPDANIQILGSCTKMFPSGFDISIKSPDAIRKDGFYVVPFKEFNIDDIILNEKNDVIPLYSDVFNITDSIEEQKNEEGVWRFPVNLPDLSTIDCRDFFILLTRDWTACRHQVDRIEKGYLYFKLESNDSPTASQNKLNPNKDWIHYKLKPRYRFVNCPLSKDLHFYRDSVFIPVKYNSIYIGKEGRMLLANNCNFHSFLISGFNVVGSGKQSVVSLSNSVFNKGAWIQNNTFSNLSGLAVTVLNCENVNVSSNSIMNTRIGAIACYGNNNVVMNNKLSRIGWMLNTRAITGGGEKLYICNNVIEDFNYGAIACGSTIPNDKASKLTYIIERNVIRYSDEYAAQKMSNILADAGGIYIGPQCTWGIIRHNVVMNMTGPHYNRGIYLDDGAKNLSIYGNLVMNTANFYDIDLRKCNTYAEGIPDHNTNNRIFHNIMTGGYMFQDTGTKESGCIGGCNLLLGTGHFHKIVIELQETISDTKLLGCACQDGRVLIPKKYKDMIEQLKFSKEVRQFVDLK